MPVERDPQEVETRYLHDFVDVKDACVLEVGCGDGRLTWRYAAAAARVAALDVSAWGPAQARQDCPAALRSRVHFMQARAETLPFPRETFDRAILAWSL